MAGESGRRKGRGKFWVGLAITGVGALLCCADFARNIEPRDTVRGTLGILLCLFGLPFIWSGARGFFFRKDD